MKSAAQVLKRNTPSNYFLVACLFPDHSFAFTTISSVHNMVLTKQSTLCSIKTNWAIRMQFPAFSSLKRAGSKQTTGNNGSTMLGLSYFKGAPNKIISRPGENLCGEDPRMCWTITHWTEQEGIPIPPGGFLVGMDFCRLRLWATQSSAVPRASEPASPSPRAQVHDFRVVQATP